MADNPALQAARASLAPTGTLRAAINLSNFLLVSGRDGDGKPFGIAPELAAEVARRVGAPIEFICYEKPDALAAAADHAVWDIGLIGAEPARARTIAFTPAYAEIECTFLVAPTSPIGRIEDVDRTGVRIASLQGAAYDLWLQRNIKHAELVEARTLDESFELFRSEGLDALAGLRPRLLSDMQKLAGGRLLDGCFASVQQAIGTRRDNTAAIPFLRDFVAEAKQSGLIARLIRRHSVEGLSVARD